MEGKVSSFEFPNPVRIGSRKTRWCAKHQCYHEAGFFYRRHGMVKACGSQFKKGAILGTGKPGEK